MEVDFNKQDLRWNFTPIQEKLNKVIFQVQILTIPDRWASLASGDKPQAIRRQEFTINCNDKSY